MHSQGTLYIKLPFKFIAHLYFSIGNICWSLNGALKDFTVILWVWQGCLPQNLGLLLKY